MFSCRIALVQCVFIRPCFMCLRISQGTQAAGLSECLVKAPKDTTERPREFSDYYSFRDLYPTMCKYLRRLWNQGLGLIPSNFKGSKFHSSSSETNLQLVLSVLRKRDKCIRRDKVIKWFAYFLGPIYHMEKDTELQDWNESLKLSLSTRPLPVKMSAPKFPRSAALSRALKRSKWGISIVFCEMIMYQTNTLNLYNSTQKQQQQQQKHFSILCYYQNVTRWPNSFIQMLFLVNVRKRKSSIMKLRTNPLHTPPPFICTSFGGRGTLDQSHTRRWCLTRAQNDHASVKNGCLLQRKSKLFPN